MAVHDLMRVLVIDDSAFSRQTITRMLEASPLVEVVGIARDGEEALRRSLELQPDLITLDLEMPRMDGFTFLRLLMARRPTPVIVVSSRAGEADVFQALELGAADFVAKPGDRATLALEGIQDELIRKVHASREVRIDKVSERIIAGTSAAPAISAASESGWPSVVAIGSSTGGPAALMQIFSAFSRVPECSFLVAQHMPSGFTAGFASRIDRNTSFAAKEAADGDTLVSGQILIAPGGTHLELVESGGQVVVQLCREDRGDRYSPSVDRLFASAAKTVGEDLLGIVLTGMGDDGARGARTVKDAGGFVIAESEESAVIFGMPKQAIRSGAVDLVLPLGEIPTAIQSGLQHGKVHRGDSQ